MLRPLLLRLPLPLLLHLRGGRPRGRLELPPGARCLGRAPRLRPAEQLPFFNLKSPSTSTYHPSQGIAARESGPYCNSYCTTALTHTTTVATQATTPMALFKAPSTNPLPRRYVATRRYWEARAVGVVLRHHRRHHGGPHHALQPSFASPKTQEVDLRRLPKRGASRGGEEPGERRASLTPGA